MSNTVFLMSDEHNPFYSSVHGHSIVQTPNMERLAERGTVYENSYCPSPLCQPSRSAFFAGRRVHEIQTYNNCNAGLRKEWPSFGKLLSDQGVHTTFVGKSNGYDNIENLGFNEVVLSKNRNSLDAFIRRDPLYLRSDAVERATGWGPRENPFQRDIEVIDAALQWIHETGSALEQPWVLCVNITKPHFPHYVTEELWDLYEGAGDLPEFGSEEESAQHPHAKDLRAYFDTDTFSEENIRGLRRGYYGCVTFVDRQIGRLMSALDERGLAETTNFVYTSDHGEMLGKFGMWWKCSLYEDSVRVPLFACGPDYDRGVRVSTPVTSLDLQASLFHCAGAERPEELSGVPLQRLPVSDAERVAFTEYHGHGARNSAFMVRKGDWKLIYHPVAENQLFNLASDPNELVNLATTEPEVAADLERELRRICEPEEENRRAEAFIKHQLAIVEAVEPES